MVRKRQTRYLRIELRRDQLTALLALILLSSTVMYLGSESMTMTTYYPAPMGVYNEMISTGLTRLARDAGGVGIRTGDRNPNTAFGGSPLVVGPQNAASEGGEIRWLGAGNNRYFYIDNFNGNMRFVSQDASGETAKFQIANDGKTDLLNGLTITRNDPNLAEHSFLVRRTDGSQIFRVNTAPGSIGRIDLGSSTPPPPGRDTKIFVNGIDLNDLLGAVKTISGTFGINCGRRNCPDPGVMKTERINVPFRPLAAHCSPAHDGYTNSWLNLVCHNHDIRLGPNFVDITAKLAHGNHLYVPLMSVNYLIIGR